MKIIHVALNSPGSPQHGLKRALESLGEVHEIDWMANRKRGIANGPKLVQSAVEVQPDLVFMQLQTENVIPATNLMQLKQLAKPPVVVNWSGDVRHPTPRHYFDIGRVVDMTLFTNLPDVDHLEAANVRSGYLQIGFDEQTFCPQGPTGESPEVVFLGNNYGNRFPLSLHRLEMAQHLRATLGLRFAVFGSGWSFKTQSLDESQEAACYRSCKIAIHQSHYNYGRYFSDRLLRAMGSGAFVLAHHWTGMESDFIDGEHLVAWETLDELSEKVDYYLRADDDRRRIAQAGCDLVHREHTWTARMPRLLQLTGLS